jgi:prepilin-type N-terminal cleavage/methylation domain-containing protein
VPKPTLKERVPLASAEVPGPGSCLTSPGISCRARGFSFAELMVVVVVLAVLVGIFVPYLERVREADRRARCSDNLRAIGTALREYAQSNNEACPQAAGDPRHPAGYTAFTGADSVSPFERDTKVGPKDVTASLWLLVRTGMVGPERFVCPGTSDTPDPLLFLGRRMRPDQRSNFSGPDHLSYSYCSPFSAARDFRLTLDKMSPDFAVMADRNPGAAAAESGVAASALEQDPLKLARVNSLNHARAGQYVLYADIHAEFQPTPWCGVGSGWQRDNIYTVQAKEPLTRPSAQIETPGCFGPDVGPAGANDSYLVPAESD